MELVDYHICSLNKRLPVLFPIKIFSLYRAYSTQGIRKDFSVSEPCFNFKSRKFSVSARTLYKSCTVIQEISPITFKDIFIICICTFFSIVIKGYGKDRRIKRMGLKLMLLPFSSLFSYEDLYPFTVFFRNLCYQLSVSDYDTQINVALHMFYPIVILVFVLVIYTKYLTASCHLIIFKIIIIS